MIKTIEELERDAVEAAEQLKLAVATHADHWNEAMLAQAEALKWRRILDERELAIKVAHGEPS